MITLRSLWLDGDRLLRTVLGADARLRLERAGCLLFQHDAVTELVGTEHVGREHVTTTVTDTEVGIDLHLHHEPERIRGSIAGRTRYPSRRARLAVDGLRTRRHRRGDRGRVLGRQHPC